MSVPDEPGSDPVTSHLLHAFHNISRGRRFLSCGASAFPMRLSAREITDWIEVHPSPLSRKELDRVMFALDEVSLADEGE